MTFVAGFAAYLLLPLVGIAAWRVDAVRRMNLAARLAIAWAAGALITSAVMSVFSILRIEWSRTRLLLVLAAIAVASFKWSAGASGAKIERRRDAGVPLVITGLFVLLTLYGALTARINCGDLQYFWGPKAVRFFRAGGVDPGFLGNPDYHLMHPDYPPLLPLIYAWSNTLSHQFSWFAAVALTPLLLLGCAAIVRSGSGSALDGALVVALLAQPIAIGYAAGGGDPPLLLFETLALMAVTFIHDARAQIALASLGLAGAVLMKIEGTTFAIALLLTVIIIQRRPLRAAIIAAPAAALLACWIAFAASNGLADLYAAAGRYPMQFAAMPKALAALLRAGSYDVFWLPWIAPTILIALGRTRRALVPLAVALLTLGAALYFYIHVPDPTWWIEVSGPRVLMTPLLALAIAAAAAWSERAESEEGRSTRPSEEVRLERATGLEPATSTLARSHSTN